MAMTTSNTPWGAKNKFPENSHAQRYLAMESRIKDAHYAHWLACERYENLKASDRTKEKLDALEDGKRVTYEERACVIKRFAPVMRVLSEAMRLEGLLAEVEERLKGALTNYANLEVRQEMIAEVEQDHQWRLEEIAIYEAHL